MSETSTDEKLKAAREAVVLQDQKQTLDFTRRLAEAGQKAMGLDLGKNGADEMIVGDVRINMMNQVDVIAEAQQSPLRKWIRMDDTRIVELALPEIGMLVNFPEQHQIGKHVNQWNDPENHVIAAPMKSRDYPRPANRRDKADIYQETN